MIQASVAELLDRHLIDMLPTFRCELEQLHDAQADEPLAWRMLVIHELNRLIAEAERVARMRAR